MLNGSELTNKRNRILLILVIWVGFLVFGFSENIKGPAIPRMQSDFSLDEMQVGMLLALNSLGYLLACSFTGILSRKIGLKAVSQLAFGSMVVSGVLIYFSANYTFLSASYDEYRHDDEHLSFLLRAQLDGCTACRHVDDGCTAWRDRDRMARDVSHHAVALYHSDAACVRLSLPKFNRRRQQADLHEAICERSRCLADRSCPLLRRRI